MEESEKCLCIQNEEKTNEWERRDEDESKGQKKVR